MATYAVSRLLSAKCFRFVARLTGEQTNILLMVIRRLHSCSAVKIEIVFERTVRKMHSCNSCGRANDVEFPSVVDYRLAHQWTLQ